MRLTEERIDFINRQILQSLISGGLIGITGRESSLLVDLNRALLKDLSFEDRLDNEVREMIGRMKRQIPEGSAEWNSIFMKKKEELSLRHNYVL